MKDFLDVLQVNYQAQIAGYYNDDKTDEERKIRGAVIQEYEDLIAIFKNGTPRKDESTPAPEITEAAIKKFFLNSVSFISRGVFEFRDEGINNACRAIHSAIAEQQANFDYAIKEAIQEAMTWKNDYLKIEEQLAAKEKEVERLKELVKQTFLNANKWHFHDENAWQTFKQQHNL